MFFIIGAYANIRGTILHWPQAFVRASKYVALFALLLLPFFEPVGLRHVISSIFGTKYLVMQVVAIAVIAVLYVFRTPRDKFGLIICNDRPRPFRVRPRCRFHMQPHPFSAKDAA